MIRKKCQSGRLEKSDPTEGRWRCLSQLRNAQERERSWRTRNRHMNAWRTDQIPQSSLKHTGLLPSSPLAGFGVTGVLPSVGVQLDTRIFTAALFDAAKSREIAYHQETGWDLYGRARC